MLRDFGSGLISLLVGMACSAFSYLGLYMVASTFDLISRTGTTSLISSLISLASVGVLFVTAQSMRKWTRPARGHSDPLAPKLSSPLHDRDLDGGF